MCIEHVYYHPRCGHTEILWEQTHGRGLPARQACPFYKRVVHRGGTEESAIILKDDSGVEREVHPTSLGDLDGWCDQCWMYGGGGGQDYVVELDGTEAKCGQLSASKEAQVHVIDFAADASRLSWHTPCSGSQEPGKVLKPSMIRNMATTRPPIMTSPSASFLPEGQKHNTSIQHARKNTSSITENRPIATPPSRPTSLGSRKRVPQADIIHLEHQNPSHLPNLPPLAYHPYPRNRRSNASQTLRSIDWDYDHEFDLRQSRKEAGTGFWKRLGRLLGCPWELT